MAIGTFSQQFSDAVHDSIVSQMRLQGEQVVRKAEQLAPVHTGYLRSTIDFKIDEHNYSVVFFVLAEYGIFQEFGTRYMAAHPYLRPALNEIPDIYGFDTSMAFQNVPQTDKKLLVHGHSQSYLGHQSLTAAQKHHIKNVLTPSIRQHRHGNVGRARVRVRHIR